ncbi:MAG TPA: DUF58 domain-containing protein [Pirellulaceae bacterium]
MPASKRFLPPEVIARISRLDLRARAIVEGFLSGMHRSPYFGQSVEFRQHREYAVGDDLRHVDWKVWARQDRLYVKQFEEDTNLRCHLLVDVSRSMRYGRGPLTKFDCARTLACCLAYLVLRQSDAVGCTTFDDRLRAQVPCRNHRGQLQTIVTVLDQQSSRDKTDLTPVFARAAEQFPARGLCVLISDVFAPREGLFQGLRLFRQRGHEVLLLHVLDDDELDFSFSGPMRFDDLESDATLHCNPRALREGYLQALNAFLAEVRHGCARASVDYALVATGQPLDAALGTFLARRQARRRERR